MTAQIRRDVKQAVVSILAGVAGITAVYPYKLKSPSTINPYVEVYVGKSEETRLTQSAPSGFKQVDITVQVLIYERDISNDGSGQLNFDDLLDAIDVALRQNIQPSATINGGTLLAVALEQITTTSMPPTLNGQIIQLLALKQFDVLVQVTG